MAHTISTDDWNRTLRVLDAQTGQSISQQQQMMRLLQYLNMGDTDKAAQVLARGFPIDTLLLRESEGGAPGVDTFFAQVEATLGHPLNHLTALVFFARENQVEQVAWLLANQAQPNMVIDRGLDAAWVALEAEALDAYDLLMNAGASPSLRLTDGSRRTRLMAATVKRQVSVVSDLIARKADVQAYDSQGQLAFHLSLRQDPYTQQDLEITQLLLTADSSLEFEDNAGVAPMDLMTRPEHVALLRNKVAMAKAPKAPRPIAQPTAPEPTAPVSAVEPSPTEPTAPAPSPRARGPRPRP